MAQDRLFDWNQLLDGNPHIVDLNDYPAFEGGIDSVRSFAYRHAERRRHIVTTHKLDPTRLQIQARDVKPPCDCGARPGERHTDNCYRYLTPQQQLDVNVPTSVLQDPDASDDDLLLGPCSCGEAPACQPHCIRVAGA